MKSRFKQEIEVLIVEDNPGDRELFFDYLEQAGSFLKPEPAASLSEAIDKLSRRRFDVVLLDLMLSDSQGIDTFHRLHREVPDVPIVVITGLGDDDVGLEAVRGGAQDYLVKGRTDPELLLRSLRYAIERHRLLLELASEREKRKQERDEMMLRSFSASVGVAARLYGIKSLAESSPAIFAELVNEYSRLLIDSLESQVKQIQHDLSSELRGLADRLGLLGAGPRDVIEVHKTALQTVCENQPPVKAKALTEEGRFLLLELMGHLVSFYRRYCVGAVISEKISTAARNDDDEGGKT